MKSRWIQTSVQPGSPFGLPDPWGLYPTPTRFLGVTWFLQVKKSIENYIFWVKKTEILITMRAIGSFHHYLLWSFLWRFTVKNICMIEQWLFKFRNSYHKPLNTLKKKNIHINQNDFIPEVTVVRFCFQQWCIKQSLICLCHLSM